MLFIWTFGRYNIIMLIIPVLCCMVTNHILCFINAYNNHSQLKFVTAITACIFCISVVNWDSHQGSVRLILSFIIGLSAIILLVVTLMLNRLPQAIESLPFKVPFVPFVPCLSIILNLYLMMELNFKTWIRFSIWLIIGLLIYAFYGLQHSIEGVKDQTTKTEEGKNEQKISN
ncbi:hypothetical protein AGLY_013350 [Aphis glycines]|uniref:Cationic amino acid transporter C-terminal domain-containing protein n=1 Tax=Aphis glycines TaxID=307491 RepID=A0A6G0T7C9_APHGL|nr:hypothetical protein AGLY_013350 [Aphis glycines]